MQATRRRAVGLRRPILPSRSRRSSRPPAGWAVRGIAVAPSAPTRRLPKVGGRAGNKAGPASGRAQAPNRTGLTKGPRPPSSPHADRDPPQDGLPPTPSPLLLLIERRVTTSIKGKAELRGQSCVLIGWESIALKLFRTATEGRLSLSDV